MAPIRANQITGTTSDFRMGVINNITGSFSYEQKLENARAYAEGQSFIISAAIYDSSRIFAVFLLRVGQSKHH